jgi:hypothetical protein
LASLTPNLSAVLQTDAGLRRVRLTTSSNDFDEAAIFTKRRSFANDELIKAPSFRLCLQPELDIPGRLRFPNRAMVMPRTCALDLTADTVRRSSFAISSGCACCRNICWSRSSSSLVHRLQRNFDTFNSSPSPQIYKPADYWRDASQRPLQGMPPDAPFHLPAPLLMSSCPFA